MQWMQIIAGTAVLALGSLGPALSDEGSIFGGGAKAKTGPDLTISAGQNCPASLSGMASLPGIIVGCWCPPDRALATVWGSGPYTADSDICAAARHAGTIGTGGGAVWARMGSGLDSFSGSAANGVTTQGYGSYGATYIFLDGKRAAVAEPSKSLAACPGDMKNQDGTLKCQCAPSQMTGGTVWGSGPYTHDSNLCRAALHAGAISETGGPVTVRRLPGLESYAGSTQNGVSSQSYGKWDGSIEFVR